ncbi:butyrophilin subfamily 3 member A3-like isoform X6 [Carassius gibelio]|uniref:butyrophilin subfamily 3 member A3-like isoform X6 n=1 Tax=Carassius gibelio TaxID=101364 RepID=UPI002277F81F|nr:butyrophilin subfamily 3 member A3-like isoform X6 [Carassius gibelio]
MLLIIVVLLVNLQIETSVSLTVVVPPDPIEAHVGSTVILPCWISPPENAGALEIRWYRQDQFSNPVLLYNHGKIQDIQEESYRNRSSLTLRSDQSGGLKDGDVSLRLEKLRVQDDGSFQCYVSGENSYGSEEVTLKITALGSAPVLSPESLDDGRVNISCRSSGWYPEPSVSWTSEEGRVLRPGGTSHTRGADEMISVHSWTAVSLSDAQLVSCSVSLRTGELKEGILDIQGIVSSGKKPVNKNCEEGTLQILRKEVVEEINIEELRKHADEITIDRKRSHPGLIVSEDCKMVKDRPGYKQNVEKFSYELCAFGAQRFTSGRHYWEVELKQANSPPKIFWIIGVEERYLTKRKRFLCSDGPRGFYTNTDQPVKLSLTPRPERLGVLLDYDHGELSFYNVTERKHLLTISSRFSGSLVPLFNPGAGDQSSLKILDLPKPVEPAEPSQPLLSNTVAVESAVKSSDNPETAEPAEPSPLLSNMVAVESAVELVVKSSDNPETVESVVESRQSLTTAQKV